MWKKIQITRKNKHIFVIIWPAKQHAVLRIANPTPKFHYEVPGLLPGGSEANGHIFYSRQLLCCHSFPYLKQNTKTFSLRTMHLKHLANDFSTEFLSWNAHWRGSLFQCNSCLTSVSYTNIYHKRKSSTFFTRGPNTLFSHLFRTQLAKAKLLALFAFFCKMAHRASCSHANKSRLGG